MIEEDTFNQKNIERYSGIKTLVNRYAHHVYDPNDHIEWFWHASGQTTMHEIYHLLTLSHTVRHGWGGKCSSSDSNFCNDYCQDTPTPYEMVNIYNCIPPSFDEPACGWNKGNEFWCSNNVEKIR